MNKFKVIHIYIYTIFSKYAITLINFLYSLLSKQIVLNNLLVFSKTDLKYCLYRHNEKILLSLYFTYIELLLNLSSVLSHLWEIIQLNTSKISNALSEKLLFKSFSNS